MVALSRHQSGSPVRLRDLPVVAILAAAIAWTLLIAASAGERPGPYGSSMAVGTTLYSGLVFLAAWEVMVVAMMLPSSLGFLALFRAITAGRQLAGALRVSVCVGYALAWAEVGFVTILLSELLYRSDGLDLWLEGHSNLLAGTVLVLAGAYQFSSLKRRCLAICVAPQMFLMRHYRRGVLGSLLLGLRFGLVCIGCCWALMALLVILGAGSLLLMGLLTAIMLAERTFGWDRRFVRLVGAAAVCLGLLVGLSPSLAPGLTSNAANWVQLAAAGIPAGGSMAWCHG
jgi:predicted metal-binding membrane protein